MKIKLLLLLLISVISNSLFAQTTENPFYTNGKIYVVVTVLSIIFIGIVIYLVIIDKRLKRTEKSFGQPKGGTLQK